MGIGGFLNSDLKISIYGLERVQKYKYFGSWQGNYLSLVENLRGVSFLGALPHRESDGLTEGRHAPSADRRRIDRTAKGKTKDQNFSGSMDSGSHLVKWQRLFALSIGVEK